MIDYNDISLAAFEPSDLNQIINRIPDPVYVKNRQHHWVLLNDAYCDFIGFSREKLLGKTVFDLYAPEKAQLFWDDDERVLANGSTSESEEEFPDASGQTRTAIIRKARYLSASGKHYIVGVIHDLTWKKQVEKNLRDAQQRVNLALLASHAGVWEYDLTTGKGIWDENVFLQFGLRPNSRDISLDFTLSRLHPDHKLEQIARFKATFESLEQWKDEAHIIWPDGSDHWLEISVCVTRDDQGKPVKINGASFDITEKKQTQEEIIFLSFYDALTGLYNRMFWELEQERLDTQRQLPITVIMGDVNGLKLVNDVFGHFEGDRLLVSIAQILKESCRKEDIIARWGGDEFIILLPQTEEKDAQLICQRVRNKCAQQEQSMGIATSISLGYATKTTMDQQLSHIIKIAEDLMYKEKLLVNHNLRNSVVTSIRNALYEKNHETEEHAARLKELCQKTGLALGLSEINLKDLQIFAVMHDIGKIAVKDSILNKKTELTEDEWQEMKKHPEIGYRIVQGSPELAHISELVLTHHERWDGKGYPRELKGEEIPLLSRILSVIDAYDAMTSERPYRSALSHEKSLTELAKNSGTQFDPKIVEVFINTFTKQQN